MQEIEIIEKLEKNIGINMSVSAWRYIYLFVYCITMSVFLIGGFEYLKLDIVVKILIGIMATSFIGIPTILIFEKIKIDRDLSVVMFTNSENKTIISYRYVAKTLKKKYEAAPEDMAKDFLEKKADEVWFKKYKNNELIKSKIPS